MTAVYRDGCGCTLAVDTDRQDLLEQARGILPQKKSDQLLRMSSGLAFEESYAPFADATDMLYASRSMARFAAEKPLRTAPDAEWYYYSGMANILARIVRDTVGGTLTDFCDFARQQLFDRIGMYSAIIEPDASGSAVG